MSCDVGEVMESLENEHCCISSISMSSAHSPTFSSLHPRHNSFYNPSVALPTSQFILQPFFCFSYVTSSSLNSPGEPPVPLLERVKTWILLCSVNLNMAFISGTGNVQLIFSLDPRVMKHLWRYIADNSINSFFFFLRCSPQL